MAAVTMYLISTFAFNTHPMRLLIGHFEHHNKERTIYLIERKEVDGLGDPRWVRYCEFKDPVSDQSSNQYALLLTLIEQLVLSASPSLAAAYKMGGWPAVGAIVRERTAKGLPLGYQA